MDPTGNTVALRIIIMLPLFFEKYKFKDSISSF